MIRSNQKMAVLLDNNALVDWVTLPDGHSRKLKLDNLFNDLQTNQQLLVLPAPAVAEFLAYAGEARWNFIQKLRSNIAVKIAAFDYKAAIECAQLTSQAINSQDKKYGSDEPKQKIKVDEQIVAIAKVHQVQLIITGDKLIPKIAARCAIEVKTVDQLDLSPETKQTSLTFSKD